MSIIKTHWLYGNIKFNVDVSEETNCGACIYAHVCKMDMANFCLNYELSSSREGGGCHQCIHRYTRWRNDEDKIPCFKCEHFKVILKE